ncbi:kelch repeat-containing protein 1-like isoform X1 [Vitis riparia]|uniref:kelch repeat-containing protein 1-like isoform X1 n=1 Tax=Vitis riparia TaxID=96939 RepID=UPI00155A592C|nr:kelch repeat-containing protein 1-like isoform X1 [Vitis riparia]
MRWERLQLLREEAPGMGAVEISGPGKRWGHTCNAIKGGKLLYIFGGYGKDNCQTNQVHVFDTVKKTWNEPMIKGSPPTPRDSHSCTTVGDNLFVFGGTDGMNPLKDLHILDTSTHTWISPSVRGEGPEAREGHTAALIGKRLFIFGGCGKSSNDSDEVYYNDLYILNTETFVWKRAQTSGTPPTARDSHTCSSWKNKIIVIGGEDAYDYYLSDVHILDADTLVWRELNASGQMLPPRAGHTTVAFGKNLFVFGGFTDAQNLYDDLHMLDADTGLWTKVLATGDGPSARFSVAGDILDPQKGGVLVFVGGCNKTLEALDDMYYLHTELVRENGRDERKLERLSMRKQLKLKCQEQYLPAPGHDKALLTIGANAVLCQSRPSASYGQTSQQNFPINSSQLLQGKKIFQANITESFPDGFTIETIIDGKPLRGILFSNKPSNSNMAKYNSSRKRAAGEVGGIKLNDSQKRKPKNARPFKQDEIEHRQADVAIGKESISCERQTEAAAAGLNNLATPNDSQAQTEAAAAAVSENPEPTGDSHPQKVTGNSSVLMQSILKLEYGRTNDALNQSTESPAENTSTAAKECISLPPKEGDHGAPTTEEKAKSF